MHACMGSVSYHTTFSHHHIGLRVDPRWVSSTPTVKGARLSHLLLTAGKFGLDNVQAEIHAETSLCFLSPSILFQKEVCVCTSCILYYGISRHIESQQIYSAAWSEAGRYALQMHNPVFCDRFYNDVHTQADPQNQVGTSEFGRTFQKMRIL